MAGILLEGEPVSDEERARFSMEHAAKQREAAVERSLVWRREHERRLALATAVGGTMLSDDTVPPGGYLTLTVDKGQRLRVVDLEGRQAVDFLCFDRAEPQNRYNAANTIKINRSIYIGLGFKLYSDYGDILMTIVEDTVGSHDTIGGCCSRQMNYLRYGVPDTPNCRDNFLAALSAHGLDSRDIPANLNFFMRVPVLENGEAEIVEGTSMPGDYVELRAERDVLVAISNCPQVFNPCNGWNPTPIRVIRWAGADQAAMS